MAVRLASLMPRAVIVALGAVLATATLTLAASKQISTPKPASAPVVAQGAPLIVPDVRRQAYVFAKGTLDDAGFAWRVTGAVQGYAANVVVSQQPAPGTRVVDNGEPVVSLVLARNGRYQQKGTPQNASPYGGTPIRLADLAAEPATVPAAPVAKPLPVAKPKPARKAAVAKVPQRRPPAFVVPGAPKEPLDEMPLPDRARMLSSWLSAHSKPTNANVKYWLYQSAWIVAGAKLGWWNGAEALKLLIGVDRRVESLWGVGFRSERVARAALAEVEARAR